MATSQSFPLPGDLSVDGSAKSQQFNESLEKIKEKLKDHLVEGSLNDVVQKISQNPSLVQISDPTPEAILNAYMQTGEFQESSSGIKGSLESVHRNLLPQKVEAFMVESPDWGPDNVAIEPREKSLQEIKAKLIDGSKGNPDIDEVKVDDVIKVISRVNKGKEGHKPEDLLESYVNDVEFAAEPDPLKELVLAALKHFAPPAPSAAQTKQEEVDPHQAIIDAAKAKGTHAAFAAPGENTQQPQKPQQQQELTATALALSKLGKAVSKAFGAKDPKPGASFEALQANGQGLGMNNPNQDASNLADIAMKRLEDSANRIAELKADADPALVAKTKAEFIDAAGDAHRHISNEHRSMLTQMAGGKRHEFDASDIIKERGEKFQQAITKAEGSEVAGSDAEFKTKAEEASKKFAEQLKQLMESIKEMAKKLVGMDNDNKAGAPAPGL